MTTRRPFVDATLINDELDLLLLRMRWLAPHVDHFYVAESAETYTGHLKPMHLSENLDMFEEFAGQLTVITYGGSADRVEWKREEIARDSLRQAVAELDPRTIVYFSDLDELPSETQIRAMKVIDTPHSVPLDTFYRRANWRLECESPISVARATPVSTLPANFTSFRWPEGEASFPDLAGERGGHFSYLGFTADRLASKLAAFSHSEFVFAKDAADHLLTVSDALVLDHFGRSRLPGGGLLTVLASPEWSDLHRWLYARRPEWFDERRPPNAIWRRINAAAIDDAMREQHLGRLERVGGPSVLREPATKRVIRSQLGPFKRRLLRQPR
ncbi:hypothetical protein [Nocardioides glacieisoli]|uniref:hypothetical protein n=1 Tax=Nocardioides glacieisoli TaxID=1168730 RepID=UPI0013EA175D|nr:hypothetical protein [Nocardioides glacieisoli]